jgi:pullulanase-type alpha-1,6-glucosidase
MDVVYNHTTVSGQNERSVLDRIVPGYYQRLDATGKVERSTCCDNTATEHAMMGKLMIDSVALWAQHYRIDSFRFDLMGHQPRAAMERVQRRANAAAGRHVNLIGEGWNFGEIADGKRFVQASQLSLQDSGIGTFSDRARDALRGGGCCDSGETLIAAQGYLNGLHYAPGASGKGTRDELLRAADFVRIGLAGTLREYRLRTFDGTEQPLHAIDYKGQPAGYAAQPSEVVNYVENHDNPTLFDINAMKLPRDTTRGDRARVQLLGAAFVAFSQGVAYFHAGMDVLRSKSLDRNSFDSGDWFNRLDWTYRDNHFGTGLPPASDNGKDWHLLKPLLADAATIRPTADDIAWMRDAFRDLLRIRASSTLFRLRTAADVQQRLRFGNTGPDQNPLVIAAHLDGRDYDGANFRDVLYLINVSPQAQTLVLPEEAGKRYVLHPVLGDAQATDPRVKQARFASRKGRFVVPARTAVVFVVE